MSNNKEKDLVKNTLLFTVGNAGAKLLMLIIVPLYTYYVSTEQMGQYDLVNTYVGLFSSLACLALHEGLYRWLLDASTKDKDILKTGLLASFIAVVGFDVIAWIFLSVINYTYLPEFILLVTAAAFYTIVQFITRGLRNNKIYAVQGIVYSLALILCNVILVIWLRMQARGLLLSMAFAYIVTIVFMAVVQHLVKDYVVPGKFDRDLAKDLIKYSLPIVPNNIAWWLVSASNRIVINWGMGDAANGIYAISMKFPTLVNMLSTFFYQAWQEQAISEYDSKERDAYYTKIFNIYVKVLLTGIIALLPVTKFIIIYFMDSSYHDAYQFIGLLYLSSVFNAFAGFYGTGYLSTKKTMGALTTTMWGAIANAVLTVVLINTAGLYAAAFGSMVGNAIIWVTRIVQTRKYFNIKIEWKAFIILIGLCAAVIVAVNAAGLAAMIVLEVIACMFFLLVNKELIVPVVKQIANKAKK
ncbi:oligosaccharide flippase family protein [Blautia liquoris]|uniref:Oligosaccharide flippase family protein n=1 Tax=Blautia liquoris TaxID=2779518 RepID=A0A7M2RFE8_9FIRM|nr:oligosaccharide flippase family protein [Blautia liquoris]QOV18868.1 oligosaccharide flippase family protein [Blautia liquoris]